MIRSHGMIPERQNISQTYGKSRVFWLGPRVIDDLWDLTDTWGVFRCRIKVLRVVGRQTHPDSSDLWASIDRRCACLIYPRRQDWGAENETRKISDGTSRRAVIRDKEDFLRIDFRSSFGTSFQRLRREFVLSGAPREAVHKVDIWHAHRKSSMENRFIQHFINL